MWDRTIVPEDEGRASLRAGGEDLHLVVTKHQIRRVTSLNGLPIRGGPLEGRRDAGHQLVRGDDGPLTHGLTLVVDRLPNGRRFRVLDLE